MLPAPGASNYSFDVTSAPARPTFVPAGARVAGTIIFDECSAPNPGSPTASVAMSLMIGRTQAPQTMIQYPVSAEARIRQVGGE